MDGNRLGTVFVGNAHAPLFWCTVVPIFPSDVLMYNIGAFAHMYSARRQLEEIEIFGLVTQGQAATCCGGTVGVCEKLCPPPHPCKGGGEVLPVLCCACKHSRSDQIVVARVVNIRGVCIPPDLKFDTVLSQQVNFACAVDVRYRTELTQPFKTVPHNLQLAESHEKSRETRRETLFPSPVRAR